MRHRTTLSTALLILMVAVLLWPHPAHAAGSLLDIFRDPVSTIANIFIGALQWIQIALGKFVLWLVRILTTLLLQPGLNNGGQAVSAVWKVFRDLCNSFFLVFFILIAFSTIFHSVWKGGAGFYYRSALLNVVVAAILVNFSLPIGQTMVWAGNQATLAVMGLMRGTNIEARLAAALNIEARALNVPPVQSLYAVPDLTKPTSQLVKGQDIITANFDAEVQAAYEKCNAESQASQKDGGCLGLAMKMRADKNKQTLDAAAKAAASGSKKQLSFIQRAYNGLIAMGVGFVTSGGSPTGTVVNAAIMNAYLNTNSLKNMRETDPAILAAQMGIAVANILLLLLMCISFLCVIAFMVVRLPMIWFLLAGSAVACFFYAVPGSPRFKKWWGDMIGYNIFGPVYLFAIYIGLLVLSLQSTLLVGLKNAQWYEGLLGAFLFTGIATVIFTGGAAAAWKFAFQFSDDLKTRVSKAGDAIGVSEKSMFGLKSGSAALSRTTGATAAYEALKARGAQAYGDRAAALRGRLGLRSADETKAGLSQFLGVRGAGAELDKLTAKRVDTEKEILEAKADKITDKKLKDKFLRDQLSSGNRNAALAAGELLLKQGKLTPAEGQAMLEKYGKISPIARKEFQKRLADQSKKEARKVQPSSVAELMERVKNAGKSEDKRAFLEAGMAGEIGQMKLSGADLMALADQMDNPEDKRAFLESATKNGKNKVAAIEAMANAGLLTRRDGKRLTVEEALADRSSNFSADDWLDAEDYTNASGGMSGGMKTAYESFIQKPSNLQRMARDATDAAQRSRLNSQASDLAQDEAIRIEKKNIEKEVDKSRIEAEKADAQLKKHEVSLKRAKEKIKDESRLYKNNPVKANRDKLARAAVEYRNAMDDLREYRKSLSGKP